VSETKTTTGTIIEALPNTMFRILPDENQEDSTEECISYLAGKMRYHRIRVIVGDRVEYQIDPYGGKAKITKRL
jgi:translation initiation factor IF-1